MTIMPGHVNCQSLWTGRRVIVTSGGVQDTYLRVGLVKDIKRNEDRSAGTSQTEKKIYPLSKNLF